jgi:predicted RNase H-like HicB family nuclease
MEKLRVPLRIVFYKDEQRWVAHCLEFDLMGDGDSREQALAHLTEAITLQVDASLQNRNPENLFKPADSRLFLMFAAAKDVSLGKLHLELNGLTITNAEMREYESIAVPELVA